MSEIGLLVTPGERLAVVIVFALYLVSLVFIGVYARKRLGKTAIDRFVEEYYTGGRLLGAIVVAFLIAAGLCSVGTFVGGPGLSWRLGMPWFTIIGSQIFMNFFILIGLGKLIGIVARRVGALSLGDILFERYERSKSVVVLYALPIVIFLTAYSAAQFVGSSRIFEVMTGWSYKTALILTALVTIFYATVGGIRGVGLAAMVQGTFMTVASLLLAVGVFGGALSQYGSFAGIHEALVKVAGDKYVNPFALGAKIVTSWWIIFSVGVLVLPHGLMGALTYKDTGAMKRAVYLGVIVVTVWTYIMLGAGFLGKLWFPKLPVPDHVIPALTMKLLPSAVAGIVFAGVISAAQSTIATMTILISSAVVQNIYRELIRPGASPEGLKRMSVYTTFTVGVVALLLAITEPPALEYIIIMAIGGIMSAIFWPVVLGFLWPRGNRFGAIAGMLVGLVVYGIAKVVYKPLALGFDPVIIGTLTSLLAYLAGTYISGEIPSERVIRIFWGSEPPRD
ncbi:MAG: hypothetical protein H5T91_03915 [Synergistetes bacterium]|nr:hypothetical protein [Synergistota bacterium]